MTKSLPLTVLAISSVLFVSGAHAATKQERYFASPDQLKAIHAGQTQDDVIRLLGKPEYTPSWQNGVRSLAYETLDNTGAPQAQAYVDIDSASGKVIGVSVQSQN